MTVEMHWQNILRSSSSRAGIWVLKIIISPSTLLPMLTWNILTDENTLGKPALSISNTSDDAATSFLITTSLIMLLVSFTRNPVRVSLAYPNTASAEKLSLLPSLIISIAVVALNNTPIVSSTVSYNALSSMMMP